MTETSHDAGQQPVNGQASGPVPAGGPAPGEPETAAERTPVSERIMGVIGIAFAVGLLVIGLDLATGGAVSRLIAGATSRDTGDDAG